MAWLKGLTLDPTTWRKVWVDLVQAAMVSVTPGANKIPQADATGKLDVGWVPAPDLSGVLTNPMTAGGDMIYAAAGSPAANVALVSAGATATASSVNNNYMYQWWYGNCQPINVLADSGGAWISAQAPADSWVKIDLGSAVSIAQYRIVVNTSGLALTLDYSTNGADWTTAVSYSSVSPPDTGVIGFSGSSAYTARYWRLTGAEWVHLIELWRAAAPHAPTRLPIGTTGQVMTTVAGLPAWAYLSVGGDLSGTAASATVAKLRDRTVAATSPADGQALVWNNGASQWEPGTVSGGTGAVPAGGTTGQVLTKASGTDYDASWASSTGGGSTDAEVGSDLYLFSRFT